MSEPVDTSAEAVRVTNPGYAEYLNSPAGKIITEQREQIVSLQSSLTAAQQRIADLEAQCARVQRDAERYRFLRDSADRDDDGCPFIALNVWSGLSEDDDPDFLDCDTQWLTRERAETAIDAAMAAKGAG